MQNRVCEILGIKYPIIQGAMQWVSDASLVSAVSEAGGLGVLATADADKEVIRKEIWQVREATDKPFAVNITLLSKTVKEMFELVVEEKVPFVVTTAGNPAPYIPLLKEAGIPFFSVVATVRQGIKMEEMGACLVVVEGQEAGGHIGEMTTMALVPQTVSALHIPVVAAGGIADGRGLAAAFMLGAQGVQMGTIFLTSKECTAHEEFKQRIIEASSKDVVVTGREISHPVRCLENELTKAFGELGKNNAPKEEYLALGTGAVYKAVKEGDVKGGSVMAGQIVGLVNSEKPVKDIMKEIITHYNSLCSSLVKIESE